MPETDLRARSAADYLRMLQHLLPQGQAWTRAPGAVLTAVLQASADELERLDMAMRLLLMEILPTSAIAGLEDWERVLGLPDACLPAGTTLQERRSAVLAKLRDEGRQDLAYWYGVADSLEYDVTIEEHWPFCCGIHQCADPSGLTPEEIAQVEIATDTPESLQRETADGLTLEGMLGTEAPDAGGDPGPSRDRLSGRAGDPLVVERHRPRRPSAPLPLRREPVR